MFQGILLCIFGVFESTPILNSLGGEEEIRTLDTLSDIPVFKTGAFNRSATSPIHVITNAGLLTLTYYRRITSFNILAEINSKINFCFDLFYSNKKSHHNFSEILLFEPDD